MATGTRKKTTQKKKTTGTTASKARKQREQQESFRNEVILWITLAVCIVLLLAQFWNRRKTEAESVPFSLEYLD